MKTRDELLAEYDRLFEAEDYEAANKVLDLIEPVSDEEWLAAMRSAPEVDEPVPEFIKQRSRELAALLRGRRQLAAG